MKKKGRNKRRITAVLCAGAIALMPMASFGATDCSSYREKLDCYIGQNCSQSVNFIYSDCQNAIDLLKTYFGIDNNQGDLVTDDTQDDDYIGISEEGNAGQQQADNAGGSEQQSPSNAGGTGNEQQTSGGNSQQQSSGYTAEVVSLVNVQRSAVGLGSLASDSELSKIAQLKAEDMAYNNYFSHTSPTYGSAFDMMQSHGYSFRTAGENIAMGQTSPAEVMNAWMNSQGHKENILKSSFTKIGVGYALDSNGSPYWVQIFAG